jgi:hypothetical protein
MQRIVRCILAWLALLSWPASAANTEMVLEQQPAPFLRIQSSGYLQNQDVPFRKAPALGKQPVFRQWLKFGQDTNNALGLIWDRSEGKLYLDLNRNLDLTDDPVFVNANSRRETEQYFTNITFNVKQPGGWVPVVVDMRIFDSDSGRGGRIYASMQLRSFWQAKVDLHGKPWQVGLIVTPFTDRFLAPFGERYRGATEFLVLRPWAERTNFLTPVQPLTGAFPYTEQVYCDGEAFKLSQRWENRDGKMAASLSMEPQQPKLVELTLTGQFVNKALLFPSNGYSILLSQPAGMVKIPPGFYNICGVSLKNGDVEAMQMIYDTRPVDLTSPTKLALGGPLTNSVQLTRQGKFLRMNYMLVGTDQAMYQLTKMDRSKPPEFCVYRNGKKISAGKFEFG